MDWCRSMPDRNWGWFVASPLSGKPKLNHFSKVKAQLSDCNDTTEQTWSHYLQLQIFFSGELMRSNCQSFGRGRNTICWHFWRCTPGCDGSEDPREPPKYFGNTFPRFHLFWGQLAVLLLFYQECARASCWCLCLRELQRQCRHNDRILHRCKTTDRLVTLSILSLKALR